MVAQDSRNVRRRLEWPDNNKDDNGDDRDFDSGNDPSWLRSDFAALVLAHSHSLKSVKSEKYCHQGELGVHEAALSFEQGGFNLDE